MSQTLCQLELATHSPDIVLYLFLSGWQSYIVSNANDRKSKRF